MFKPWLVRELKVVNFRFTQTIYHINKVFFCHVKNEILLKNIFKVILQHLFNGFKLFNNVSYIILNFKLKIDSKVFTFKNLEEV